jgi:Protein of unknown function (DUF3617)
MTYRLAGLLPLALLAACGKGEVELENASVEDVVKATANAQALNPGQWSNQTKIVSVEIPGMPQAEKKMMDAMTKAMVGQTTATESCVTPEQAKKPDATMFAGQGNNNCTFEKFSMAGGRMDAVMSCDAGAQGQMKMTMGGAYGGDNYALDSEIVMSGAPGMPGKGEMKIKASNTGKRTGECKPA